MTRRAESEAVSAADDLQEVTRTPSLFPALSPLTLIGVVTAFYQTGMSSNELKLSWFGLIWIAEIEEMPNIIPTSSHI